MRDGEFGKGIISPEAGRGRFSDDVSKLPRGNEGLNLHLAVGGDRVPEATYASGAGKIGER